ncbi:MAG TPA: PfkB family carbohydrate kinase, partial [Solirubrobacteraceae bacterium]|nr:PfkB family carbohydrate kinase [Solirubrobacteraceae bacterium]
MTIVVVGDLMVDVVAALPGPLAHGSDTPARITHVQGGSGANVAAWLAQAGADVAFAGRAGTDPLGDAAVAALAGVTLAVERDPERPTGTCIVLVHPGGERTMIPDAGANAALELHELPGGGHLHLTGYTLLRPG